MKIRRMENGSICHVYNRGVEKREVFSEEENYLRFIHDLFEFNDEEPAPNLNYHLNKAAGIQYSEVRLPNIGAHKGHQGNFWLRY